MKHWTEMSQGNSLIERLPVQIPPGAQADLGTQPHSIVSGNFLVKHQLTKYSDQRQVSQAASSAMAKS